MNKVQKEIVSNPDLMLDIIEKFIKYQLEQIEQNNPSKTVNAQLLAISKAIEKLEKDRISIPETFLAEKSRLLSLVSTTSDTRVQILQFCDKATMQISRFRKAIGVKQADSKMVSNGNQLITSLNDMIDVTILALKDLGGSGLRKEIHGKVYEIMKDKFLPGDFVGVDGDDYPVWKRQVNRALSKLRNDGITKPQSMRGFHELIEG